MSLDNLLSSQKSPLEKRGFILKDGQCSTSQENEQHIKNDEHPPTFKKDYVNMYNKYLFHGYFSACNYFGHKTTDCIFLVWRDTQHQTTSLEIY
jgi:hypothetical protein